MPKLMPLLEPSMQTIQNVSRRGSTMLPSDIRRSSIHDMSLSSAPSSRRESIATELDFSSRSTSPLSFHRESKSGKPIMDDAGLQTTRKEEVQQYPLSNGPTLPSCIMGEDGLEAYKRRHSIATAEPGVHTRRPRVLSMPRNRAYHSSNTMNDIPDQQSYSAPSSPSRRAKVLRPPASTIPGYPPIQRLSETVDMSTESFGLPSYGVQPPSHHPYAKALAHRRTSLLMQEAEIEPDVSRRASMPMTSLNTATDPTNGHPMHQYARPPTDLTSFAPAHHGSSSGNKQHPRDVSVPRSSEIMYSRTPELRVSHKLAERKRRKEMKELFDELRDILPVERSLKTSKWEILSRSIEYVSALKQRDRCAENEVAALRQLVAQKRDQQ
ncbi:uncharacterized protein BYT42DRAFT_260892 [Radiomyces spectabilis]|uniref:uncharacterized protein n=1 Tax=Radiomyces spectabilis TaxID=64574 RepID=UPI00221F3856|nr:uncharacterized protein BYT42DRAFT_260892 [Radiomyces spectabilis]KAI8384433.1 hypothetical protein BYT42DRAFT_260892 [Radiomyces spectabilis]